MNDGGYGPCPSDTAFNICSGRSITKVVDAERDLRRNFGHNSRDKPSQDGASREEDVPRYALMFDALYFRVAVEKIKRLSKRPSTAHRCTTKGNRQTRNRKSVLDAHNSDKV